MTRGQRAYREFLKTEFWKEISSIKRRIVGRCERCSSTSELQCHHKVYRKSWFDTRMEDLEVVCRTCHKKEHGLYDPEFERFSDAFDACSEISEVSNKMLWKSKPLTGRQRKRLRHIAEQFRDNGGVIYRFSNVMVFHHKIVKARQCGLTGENALRFAFDPHTLPEPIKRKLRKSGVKFGRKKKVKS